MVQRVSLVDRISDERRLDDAQLIPNYRQISLQIRWGVVGYQGEDERGVHELILRLEMMLAQRQCHQWAKRPRQTHREDRSQSGRVEHGAGRTLQSSASRTVVAGPDRLLLRHAGLNRDAMGCDSMGAA